MTKKKEEGFQRITAYGYVTREEKDWFAKAAWFQRKSESELIREFVRKEGEKQKRREANEKA